MTCAGVSGARSAFGVGISCCTAATLGCAPDQDDRCARRGCDEHPERSEFISSVVANNERLLPTAEFVRADGLMHAGYFPGSGNCFDQGLQLRSPLHVVARKHEKRGHGTRLAHSGACHLMQHSRCKRPKGGDPMSPVQERWY